jgi:thioredoxin-related protein
MARDVPNLPMAIDLRADGEEARRKGIPVLVLFSLHGCPYCEVVRESHLLPMLADPVASKRAIIRQVDVSDTRALVDFEGRATTHGAFSTAHGVRLAPVVAFFDGRGRTAAESLTGMLLPDFYSAYLETALERATTFVRATSP